jgi:hypothetical protein
MDEQQPRFVPAPACRKGNVSAFAKFPRTQATLPQGGLADAIAPDQIFTAALSQDCCAVMVAKREPAGVSGIRS